MYVDIKEGTVDGETTDDYVSVLTIDVRARRLCTIHLKNTHASATLTYQVLGYAMKDGTISSIEVSPADITSGNSVQIVITKKLATVVLQVKSKVSSTPADWVVEYIATVV